MLSALKSPTYQGFSGLADKADKADKADNRVVKIVFLSACCPPRAFVVRLKEFSSGMDMFFCREIGWKNII